MSAVLEATKALDDTSQRSEGVWHAAWRRFQADRVGLVSLVIVIGFLLLIAASALGLVAKGWPLPLGALQAPRSFVAIDNVVDLLSHMVRHPNPLGGVYLVADAHGTTTTEFIRAMARGMGKNLRLIPVPANVLLMLATWAGRGEQIRKMSVPLAIDFHSTEARLGWKPPVSMADAMQRAFSDTVSPSSILDLLP